MLPKGHLSYSQLRHFADCPAYWHAINVRGMEAPSTEAMRLGAGVHDLIARYLSGLVGEEEQVLAAHDLSPAKATEGIEMFTDWLSRWADSAEGCDPSQIEDTITWDIATEPSVPFVARLDFWKKRGDELVIHDWKTSARLPTDGEAAGETGDLWSQLLTYACGFRQVREERDRYLLRQVYVRYGVVHERTVDAHMLDLHEKALVASCQAVLLAVQADQFRRRPGRACGQCPLHGECDFSHANGGAEELARAWLFAKQRLGELDEQLRDLAKEQGQLPGEEAGVLVGYDPKTVNQAVTRTVDKQKQILGVTEQGEELWVYPRTRERLQTRFVVKEAPRVAVGKPGGDT